MHLLFCLPPCQALLRHIQPLIQPHGQPAQDDDRHQHQIQLKHLAAIDNQIPKPPAAPDKFPDDDAHQAKSDIDLHSIQKNGHGAGQHHLPEYVAPIAAQCVDELDFLCGNLLKSGIQRQNMPKTATEIPATMMVRILAPSQTMRSGARADLGRLFKTTR